MNTPRVNGHDPLQPDLSTPQAREAWGKQHGLPQGFVILSDQEMARISGIVQASSTENLRYRALGRLLFNAKTPQELAESIKNLQRVHFVTSQERDKYRLVLVEMAKAGNVVAKHAIQ